MLLPFLLLQPLVFSKSIPASCSYQKGDYSLSWYYDDLSSDVVFKLSTKAAYSNFWTGVLLGESEPTDAIGLFVRSGQIGLTDAHVSESTIIADNLTNVQSLSFDLTEDKLTAEFARPLTPQDESDADLSRCVTFFFPSLPTEIQVGKSIALPGQMESKRVCDIVDTCAQRDQIAVVKREEAPLCEYKKDKQTVSWKHEEGKYVFSFDIPVKKGKWWSSVGVGESMQELSMAVAFAENGKVKTAQGFISTGYQLPQKDEKNAHQVKLISSTVKNGKAHTVFSVNEDFIKEKEVQGCVTLQVAVNAGQFVAGPKLQKHNSLPIAVQVCGIEQCGQESKTEPAENPLDDNQLNKDGETIVDAKTETKEAIVDARKETTLSPESVVDVKAPSSAESVVDVQPKNESATGPTVDVKEPEGAGGQVVEPVAVVDVRNSTTELGTSGGEVNTSENRNETIVAFNEVTPKSEEKEQIIDAEQEKRQEDSAGQVATGTAFAENEKKEEEKADHGKKTTKKPKKGGKGKKTTKHPTEQIVDAREETVEGSGDHVEGSGDLASNETIGEDQMDVLSSNETEHTKPPIVNVDGAVDPKALSTTFSPPVSIPKLHAEESSSPTPTIAPSLSTASGAPNAPSAPFTAGPVTPVAANPLTTQASPAVVPKSCDHPEDLKICDGYFNDYLSKVQEWSTKHNHTVETSMFKACRLLSQVKHVPTMCCNLYRKTCEAYSRQP